MGHNFPLLQSQMAAASGAVCNLLNSEFVEPEEGSITMQDGTMAAVQLESLLWLQLFLASLLFNYSWLLFLMSGCSAMVYDNGWMNGWMASVSLNRRQAIQMTSCLMHKQMPPPSLPSLMCVHVCVFVCACAHPHAHSGKILRVSLKNKGL